MEVVKEGKTYNCGGFFKKRDLICKQCGAPYRARGNSKWCSRSCADLNNYEANMLDPEFRLNKLMYMAKNRSKSKGLKYDLDLEYLMGLWYESNGKCSVSGVCLDLGRAEKGKVHPYAPSLDRITPELGYTKGNVRLVCYQLNVAMSEFGLEQFDEFVKLYTKNLGNNYESKGS